MSDEEQGPGAVDQAHPTPVPAGAQFLEKLRDLTPAAYVTPLLIALNVGVYLFMVIEGVHPLSPSTDSLITFGADYGPLTANGESWRLLTSTFLHIGAVHLACNMIGLWGVGTLVERLTGSLGFLIAYLTAGLFGSLAGVLWSPYSVAAGASGAIFGIYGALMGFLVREQGTIPREILSRLRASGVAFLGYNLIFGLAIRRISTSAHLGGFAAGLVCGLILGHPLTLDAVASRRWRNLALASASAASIAMGIRALPPVLDIDAEVRGYFDAEAAEGAKYNRTLNRFNSGAIDEREFVRVIEKEILPDWRAMRTRMTGWGDLPERTTRFVALLDQCALGSERFWQLAAEGRREHDAEKLKQADAEMKSLEALWKQRDFFSRE